MIDLTGKLPIHPTLRYGDRALASITRIAIHHTGGPSRETPEQIAQFHVDTRGWPGIAYHYLVDSIGQTFKCWPATTVTYCVENGNTPTLCVCLIGNFDLSPVPDPQWQAAAGLVAMLRVAYNITDVFGHREVPTDLPQDTHCPGLYFVTDRFRKEVWDLVQRMIGTPIIEGQEFHTGGR